jgi:hypothetical protein
MNGKSELTIFLLNEFMIIGFGEGEFENVKQIRVVKNKNK